MLARHTITQSPWGTAVKQKQITPSHLGANAENKSDGEAGVIIGNGSKAITDVNPNTAKNTMGQQVVVGEASEANSQSVAIGAQVYAKGQSSIAIGGDDLGNNDSKTSAGKYSGANDWRNYAGQPITVEDVTTKDASDPKIGFTSTTASGRGSIAIGHMSQSTGKASLAFGADSHAEADGAIAAGMVAKATNSAAIALGVGANASEAHATAVGLKAQAAATDAVALGTNAVADKDNAVALGSGASTFNTSAGKVTKATVNGVEYSGFAGQAPKAGYQVSVGAKNAERQIKHVAAGAITDDSTDAINGSQLYSIANGLQTRINNGFNVTATANGGTVTGTAVDKIGNGETLKFEAGNGITINQSDNTLKISAAQAAQQVIQAAPVPVTNSTSNTPLLVNTQNGTTTISANTTPLKKNANTGGVSVETGHENKLMTAGQVAQAFTDSGFQLSTGTNGGGTKDAGSTGTEVIHPGDQVTINAGKNLAVLQQASGKVTLRLTDDISLNSVTTVDNAGNQTVTNGGGITITPAGGSAVSLTKDGLNNGGKKITNVAPGTDPTDAVNVSQLNAAKTIVKADPNSPVSVTGDGSAAKPYTVGVNTTPLSHTTNGAVNTPSTPDAGKLVTAGEIAKAINNAGFTVTSGKTGAGQVTGTSETVVKPGNTVKFVAGDGIKIDQNAGEFTISNTNTGGNSSFKVAGNDKAAGVTADDETIKAGETLSIKGTGTGTFADYDSSNIQTQLGQNGEVTIGLKKDLAVNSVTTADAAGNKTVTGPNGITITPAAPGSTPVSLTNNGLNNGGNTIKGVGSTLNTYTSGKPQGLVDLSALTPDQKASAATAGDLANMGWVLSSDKTTGNLGTAFNTQVKNANEVEFVGKNGATVSAKTDANGKHIVTVDVANQAAADGMPVVYTNAAGSKVYKQPNGTFNTAADGSGTTVQPADVIASMQGADGRTTPTAPAVKDPNTGIMTMNGGTPLTNVASAGDVTDPANAYNAVNAGDLNNSVQNLVNNGFKIDADSGTVDTVKLGETVKYAGDGNIVTTVSNNQIGFKLANTVTIGSGTGSNPVKIDGTTGTVTGLTNKTWDPDTTPITSGRAATEDQLKKVADTANAGFKVAGNDKAAGVTADDETIKAGETLSIKGTGTGAFTDYDGSNIQTQLGQNGAVTIGLKKDLAVNSVTTADAAGNKTVTGPNGITITPAAPGSTPVSLTNNGLNNGGNTIKGVGSALNTYTSGKPQGLVDLSALTPDQKASAATAGDLANMGWVLSSDKTTGNLGTAFNTQVKNANEVEFVGKNGATVSAQTDASGKHVVTVDVNAQSIGNNIQQPVVYTQADGSKVYKQPDGTFNTAADGSGTVVQPADIIASMQGADGATTATSATKDPDTGIMTMAGGTTLNNVASAGDITNPANAYRAVNAGDLNNSVQNLVNNGFKIDADSGTVDTVKLGETVKYAGDSNIITTVSNNQIGFKLANTVTIGSGTGSNPVKIDGTAGTVTGLTNITWDPATTPITSGRAATEDQLKAVADAANSAGAGFTIAGNSKAAGVTTADETIKAGETLSIKGTGTGTFADYDSSNIQTQVGANGEVTVGLKKDLNVNSVTAGNTKVDNNGITINNLADPSKNVSLTGNGLNNGGNTITNVGDGVADTDAVNVRQLRASQTNVNNLTNNVIGTDRPNITTYDVHGNVADNQNTVVEAINNMNTGGIKFFHVNDGTGTQNTTGTLSHPEDSSAKGNYGAAVGYQAKADGENSLAFGKGAQATGTNAISIGSGNVVTGNNSGAIGDPTTITGSGTYTIGNNNGVVSANNAGAFGNNNTLTGDNSRIIGNSSTVTTTDTFVMGNNSTSNVANSVVLGSNAAATSAATSSSAGTTTYASSVINGTTYNYAGATPTGVVSVGDVGKERRVQNVAAGLISADSTDAINGSQLYATNSAINALQTGAAGIVQYSNGDARPNGGAPTNHVTMVGADRNAPVTVHNVAPGVAPTDAVNVSQLQGVAGQINKVADEADAGTAAAMAAAGLPQAYLPGKSMVAVSGSTYRGKQGYAVGFSAINDGGNWIVKGIATGNSKGKFGATIGAGYQW